MFTGIVQEVGVVARVEGDGMKAITIRSTHRFLRRVKRGASIAIDGVCMTLVSRTWRTFRVDAMEETVQKTTLGLLEVGAPVNLERSFRIGDEIGGHIVSGHVEGRAEVIELRQEGETRVMRFRAPSSLVRPLIEKGFVALNGASLTVTNLRQSDTDIQEFDIYFIPTTLTHTTFGEKRVGDRINIETWQSS